MDLEITLGDGSHLAVNGLKKIVMFHENKIKDETSDMSAFHFHSHYVYSFQGNNIVIVNGADILSLNFV